jgi:glycosyltransferase involved in cell wall biosynthesis
LTTIYLVPIEPLTERYSESWYRNMPKAFEKAGFNVVVIDGEPLLNDEIKVGTFLDISSTCHYKSTQLQAIAKLFHDKKVEDGSVFFFADIEFWGIEQVRLLADMNHVKVFLTGFLHAASYTRGDAFEIAAPYQKFIEVGWIAALDRVYVGSKYHKQAFIERRIYPLFNLGYRELEDKIVVTKNPMFEGDYSFKGSIKEKRMLLTNRFDVEKNPHLTVEMFLELKKKHPDWEFVITTSRKTFRTNYSNAEMVNIYKRMSDADIKLKVGLTKDEYHEELEKAAIVVSHSPEENYGICVAESIIYGCLPLLANCASHPEFVYSDEEYLFSLDRSNDDVAKAERLMFKFESGQTSTLRLDWSGMCNIINNINSLVRTMQ